MKRFSRYMLWMTAFCFLLGGHAVAMQVDFSGQAAGTIIDDEYLPDFTVSAIANGKSGNRAMIFDTLNPTGNDTDLGSPFNLGNAPGSYGNVLIISKDLDSSDPDDYAGGGVFYFDFNYYLSSFGFHLLDIDADQNEQGGLVKFFDSGSMVGSYAFTDLVDSSYLLDHSANLVDPIDPGGSFNQVEIHLVSSGAVDNIVATPVPEPATMLLIGTGLVGLAGARRRFKK